MNIDKFLDIVDNSNAIRRIRKLQPIGGKGDYISPPTYLVKEQASHVFETRRIDNTDTRCVLLDSVQSQANRLEIALSDAIDSKLINVPHLRIDFTNDDDLKDLGVLSTFTIPHRIFDAIIRDSSLDGTEFPKTDVGVAVNNATPHNALALFQYSPATLIFGGWNSTGPLGGSGSRFQRCIVSEIIGINATNDNQKTSSRLDPLEISKDIPITGPKHDWNIDQDKLEKPKSNQNNKLKASETNHGNIPPETKNLGTSVDYALQTTTITFAGLRHLSVPDSSGNVDYECNKAAWAVLAALGLVSITEQDKKGYSLRSRCDLTPINNPDFEIIHNDGSIEQIQISNNDSYSILKNAIKNAQDKKLPWNSTPLILLPQEKLIKLIKDSRQKLLKQPS